MAAADRAAIDRRIARRFRVRGVVQGVGFRPFVYRLADTHRVCGWVINDGEGVDIHAEADARRLLAFERALGADPPQASRIASIEARPAPVAWFTAFEIRDSGVGAQPTVRMTPDLSICPACLGELLNPADPRAFYPYINCTNCGPRYSIVQALPYDHPHTTMAPWPMCERCRREYEAPRHRRFHAQPVACAECGPHYRLSTNGELIDGAAIAEAARLLREGRIVGIKGIGGYHLACDARQADTVDALRTRTFRKERPFAVMVKDLAALRVLIEASAGAQALAGSPARPIVLAPAQVRLPGVAPGNADLGVMLPYTPVHHLLFEAGAPAVLVMTSGNRSSEPIAYEDDDATARLAGVADALLVGERPIARRVDDSVVQDGPFGPVIVRRSRGYAPLAVAALPATTPLLAVGADLKNSITLVVGGAAFVSQHIGDLDHQAAAAAFDATVRDLSAMYDVDPAALVVVHDLHPEYRSTERAGTIGYRRIPVQHHRAHVASVLAERGALDARVIGVAFDGTGYGDDGTIWGGEIFAGSVREGLTRVAHLREAQLPGGDAAARMPAQAAAGFLASIDGLPDLTSPPFSLPPQYTAACRLANAGVRTFTTTSVGRLFDTAAALLGFTRPVTFEGQAAMWLEQRARGSTRSGALPFDWDGGAIDYRAALVEIVAARQRGDAIRDIARGFHRGLAATVARAVLELAGPHSAEAIVLSGGVFQNMLLLRELARALSGSPVPVWTNREVPPNDGGISLGQAALGACTV
ncbi:MAG TPA: carbamoyltransferase HypF [Vicinamibacterales bacterium]|nr:carbamoyltransferase HypF [Vicinamibacterales bacterium]